MPGSHYGDLFRISTFGESHGMAIGVNIDGCPAHLKIDETFIKSELERRKPGQSKIVTQRKENDDFEILSGVYNGFSTGAPISIIIKNTNFRTKDYDHLHDSYRPSHADFTYQHKYGIRDYRGGGRASARETVARVAAGSIAKLFLKHYHIEIQAFTSKIGNISFEFEENFHPDPALTESNMVRCPDRETAEKMIKFIENTRKNGDTCGGIVSCSIQNVPVGLGEPVFSKLSADLAKGMMSINAAKGFEIGSGFAGTNMPGSLHNDIFYKDIQGKIMTKTNHSGGIQGGISNGMPINFNVAFKPVSTIMLPQESLNYKGDKILLEGKGRHDPCVVPRAVPVVEAMAALTIADHLLKARLNKL